MQKRPFLSLKCCILINDELTTSTLLYIQREIRLYRTSGKLTIIPDYEHAFTPKNALSKSLRTSSSTILKPYGKFSSMHVFSQCLSVYLLSLFYKFSHTVLINLRYFKILNHFFQPWFLSLLIRNIDKT